MFLSDASSVVDLLKEIQLEARKIKMKNLFLILLLLLHLGTRAQAVQVKADIAQSYIRYHMKNPVHSWTGTSKELNCLIQINAQGDIEKATVNVTVKSFDSENSHRDARMLEVTEAVKYPTISFNSTSITRTAPAHYSIKGVLSFHGVDRPISFDLTEERSARERILKGGFAFFLEDHRIERPTLFMLKTDNEVKVELFVVY
jgi:polyisoprenoid-binding protein YceI